MSIPNPDNYLDQAEHLISWAGGRQAEYRRAISTAYYAVFHVVMKAAADHYVGRTNTKTSEYAQAYRHIDHRDLHKVCADYNKKLDPADPRSRNLRSFTSAVVDLQNRRNRADYDPHYNLLASDTRSVVNTARDAVQRFRDLQQDERLKLLYRLMVKVKERP